MTTVLTFTNAKGGSASTTSVVNCAAWLACESHHTLIIDTDHQADAGKLLGVASGDQAARYLRVTEADILRLIEEGKLAASRDNFSYKIARSQLDELR